VAAVRLLVVVWWVSMLEYGDRGLLMNFGREGRLEGEESVI
jgi:hypothetical protein